MRISGVLRNPDATRDSELHAAVGQEYDFCPQGCSSPYMTQPVTCSSQDVQSGGFLRRLEWLGFGVFGSR